MSVFDIDTLWDLEARFGEQPPQFYGCYITRADAGSEKVSGIFPSRSSRKKPRPVVVTDWSDDEMPNLQSVSASSESSYDSDGEWGSDESDGEWGGNESDGNWGSNESKSSDGGWGEDYWDEDDWDTEDEERFNEHHREMMEIGMDYPDFLSPRVPISEFDKYAEERKDNPFLKHFGSLRGISLSLATDSDVLTR